MLKNLSSKFICAALAASLVAANCLAGQSGLSAEHPAGWRNDGTGCYPEADPPTHWGILSKNVLSLRTHPGRPGDDKKIAGQPMADGVIRHWLVLGPIPVEGGVKRDAMDKETIPGEADLYPDEGQKAGAQVWKAVTTDGALIDFNAILGKEKDAIAYAHAYVSSPADQVIVIQCNVHHSLRLRLNGKVIGKSDEASGLRLELPLAKGLNRLLFKVGAGVTAGPPNDSWFIDPVFYGGPHSEYEMQNIRWVSRMPGSSPAAPIVVGDKLFAVAEPDLLVCVNKNDGKILWSRANTVFEAIPEEERKANPAFAPIEPQAKRIAEINDSLAKAEDDKLLTEREKLRKDMAAALQKINPKYDSGASDVGSAGVTPTSDGQNVYVWFTSCVSACYDLNGNRKWIRFDGYRNFEHGFTSSPLLADGKLILYMRDLVAVDAKTGSTAWTAPCTPTDVKEVYPSPRFHGSLVAAAIGGVKVFVTPEGDIFRVSDGKALCHNPGLVINQQIPSVVIQGGLLYWQALDGMDWPPKNKGGILNVLKLPDSAAEQIKLNEVAKMQGDFLGFPRYYNNWFMASPLVHEGLVYGVNCNGILMVYDVAGGKVLYQKWLNLNQFENIQDGFARGVGASPALAGKYIYITGNFGTTLVIKPGRTYEQVACNHTECWVPVKDAPWLNHVERTVSCPVFDGKCMYYRGEANLYCMEEKP